MLMCLSAALVGVIAFLRKQSLLGESLSHATYPGVVLGVIAAGEWDTESWLSLPFFTIIGAFISALIGLWSIQQLERRWKIKSDSALCFILSIFFGIGITLASRVQFTHTMLYIQSLSYLYGQAATMTDIHILIYGFLSMAIICIVILFYKDLYAITFDRDFAKSIGIKVNIIDALLVVLVTLAVVVGIRSVGVILMSAMLIAPAVAARQYTHRLSFMMIYAGIFGIVSGYLGNYLSVEMTNHLMILYPSARLILPTGPMIVMVITFICVFSLLFAPERGLVIRMCRVARFRFQCLSENVLKTMWKMKSTTPISLKEIQKYQDASRLYLQIIFISLIRQGWIKRTQGLFQLTHDGIHRAAHIVRLHRLWEVYLADYVGVGADRVHRSAEEMEHILTPELEKELTLLLKDPKLDPHHQPIPPNFAEKRELT
jgi:manganese/zinc/iron transport system permease protein